MAEIVAIWKSFETRTEMDEEAHSPSDDNAPYAEIRWFYERHDLAGQPGVGTKVGSNEVFETDDVTVLEDLSAILAPAQLKSDPAAQDSNADDEFGPVQTFVCHRFWHTNRKSLMPCGDLGGREKRARLYSQVLPKSYPATSQVAEAPRKQTPALGWTESVKRIIATLNLKEASKGVYNHGDIMIGREKEMSQLLSFFRAAITGQPGPGGIRSSIFLAGAPGVGKTACIRSAIAKLYGEQARGELPAFSFIPLNGMELRHPFDAYVKLWEAIADRKHVGSHEKACQQLEYYFTNPKAAALEGRKEDVTVVLLDEIDYLVTEKQSVLYNFFDWPKRAASLAGGRRLVVVGISNTLNLAEQLMPSVQSRVGSERIVFKAYSVKDATAILKAKITEAAPVSKRNRRDGFE